MKVQGLAATPDLIFATAFFVWCVWRQVFSSRNLPPRNFVLVIAALIGLISLTARFEERLAAEPINWTTGLASVTALLAGCSIFISLVGQVQPSDGARRKEALPFRSWIIVVLVCQAFYFALAVLLSGTEFTLDVLLQSIVMSVGAIAAVLLIALMLRVLNRAR